MVRRIRVVPPSPVHSIPTSAPAAQADPPPLPGPIPTPAAATLSAAPAQRAETRSIRQDETAGSLRECAD